MSDTPRADELEREMREGGDDPEPMSDLARELERENARLRANIKFPCVADALIKCGIIHHESIDDAEGYDGGFTRTAVDNLCVLLSGS